MFMFEDIVTLDDRGVQLVLRKVETRRPRPRAQGRRARRSARRSSRNMSDPGRREPRRGDRAARPAPAVRGRGGAGEGRPRDPRAGGVRPDRDHEGGRTMTSSTELPHPAARRASGALRPHRGRCARPPRRAPPGRDPRAGRRPAPRWSRSARRRADWPQGYAAGWAAGRREADAVARSRRPSAPGGCAWSATPCSPRRRGAARGSCAEAAARRPDEPSGPSRSPTHSPTGPSRSPGPRWRASWLRRRRRSTARVRSALHALAGDGALVLHLAPRPTPRC